VKLAQDVEDSVNRPSDGYWDMLLNNSLVEGRALQDNFRDVVSDIADKIIKLLSV
jgi:hypothetical protein